MAKFKSKKFIIHDYSVKFSTKNLTPHTIISIPNSHNLIVYALFIITSLKV